MNSNIFLTNTGHGKLDQRSTEEEIMDNLTCEGPVLDQTLRELHLINTWLGGNQVILSGIEELLRDNKQLPEVIHIADLGCGGGDLLKIIVQWARKKNLKTHITGIDANPYITNYASNNTKDFPEIEYSTMNIFDPEFSRMQFDIFTCTLFCHHFTEEQLAALFTGIRQQATIGLVINDIHRHWLAYHSIRLLTRLFSKSSMVKYDAQLSVLRAFRKEELESLFQKAAFSRYHVRWKWAFRYQAVAWK